MDETRATILRGCMLARQLEENLERFVNQPETLTRFCDDIICVFGYVKSQQLIKSRQDQRRTQTSTTAMHPAEIAIKLDRTFQKPRIM